MAIQRRLLRSGSHRARCLHRCDNCEQFIFPTDLYTVTVEIRGTGKTKWLFVQKEHEHPNCPYKDGDDAFEHTTQEQVSLPLAA